MLAHYADMIAHLERSLHSILFFMIQNALFSSDPMSRSDIAKAAQLNYQTVTKILNSLVERKAPITKTSEGRTKMYKLQLDDLDEFIEKL